MEVLMCAGSGTAKGDTMTTDCNGRAPGEAGLTTRAAGITRRRAVAGLGLAALAPIGRGAMGQQQWPTRPVRLVVAYPAGGGTDIVARLFSDRLAQLWGQPVIVENRGGAAGTIGAESVARAAPDGYTLLVAASPEIAIARSTQRNLAYDPVRDFDAITLINQTQFVLYATARLPANNVQELIALARARPGELNYGSFGNGTSNHFVGELFKMSAGVDVTHIPYRGGGPMMADLISGTVQLAFEAINTGLPHVRGGRLKALGAAMMQRSPLMPEVPTFDEQGVKGFTGGSWVGMVAPKGTPQPIINRVATDVKRLLDAGLAAEFEQRGLTPDGRGPAEFGAFIEAEVLKWGSVAQRAGITAG
jgi:tripartite-type tricarboxylate transporter receptor subunit TctC